MRGLQGRPVQPRDARGALQGQDDLRGARDADRRGRRVLQADQQDRPPPRHPRRRRARLRPARPAGADAVRRRGPAGQAGLRAAEALDRPDDLRAGRADDRAALRGREQAARRAAVARRQGQHRAGHRAQPRRDQDRRLDHRHGSRGRFRRRKGGGEGTPEQVATEPASYTGRFLRRVLEVPDRPAPAARKRSAGPTRTKSAAIRTPARTRR